MSALYAHLCDATPADWQRAVDTIASGIHVIDRNATRIWFSFYPLELQLALEAAEAAGEDRATTARRLGLMGRWRLADQIDSSHRFLFAHRYWPQVKSAIQSFSDAPPSSLAALCSAIADAAGRVARLDREFLLGMSAVGLMTLRQVGVDAFEAAPGRIHLSERARALSPHQILRKRAKDDWQGVLGFTRGLKRQWTVTFDEADAEAQFTVIHDQDLAGGARTDKRDYRSRDERCTPDEGPIPVECRAASCGTCWVGVLGGAEKLSPVVERDEAARMKVFGYIDTTDERPLIRLACQARATGAVSVVIPPWNGMFGKELRKRQSQS